MKKFLLILLVFIIIGSSVIYMFRHEIFQVSADKIIKKLLPSYVQIDSIDFEFKEGTGTIRVKGFAIKNPKGFKDAYMVRIASIICRARLKGANILDGIEIYELEGLSPVINIERLSDGRLNVNEMGKMMEAEKKKETVKTSSKEKPTVIDKAKERISEKAARSGKKLSDILKLTDTIKITEGQINFIDRAVSKQPYYLSFEDASGDIKYDLRDNYTTVESVGSKGRGFINGDRSQRIDWDIALYPQRPDLTMSNRYEVDNVDITLFRLYYEEFSPILIDSGRFSGTLVFDFDNGNIGSMNTIVLKHLKFSEKKSGSASSFWNVGMTDIVKYLQSSPDEIVFDFKIKGNMKNPKFYPGPRVEKAMQRMVVNKVAEFLNPGQKEGQTAAGGGQAASGGEKSEVDRAIDIFKGLLEQYN